jgi:hypothetical protein
MLGGESFFPPVQYSPLWFFLGLGLIALIIVWYVIVAVITRKRAVPPAPVSGFSLPLTVEARERYLGFIDEVGDRYARGRMTYSEAHHEISVIVRAFAAEAGGVRAPYMTLADLRAADQPQLADTVEGLYPGAFSGVQQGPVDLAVDRARGLVSTWN